MARVKFKNLDGVQKLVVDSFTELKNEQRTLLEVAEFTKDRVQQQTRLGKSLPNDARLKPLSADYRKARRSKKNVDREFFGPDRSNLTLTGQMLRSLKSRIVRQPGSIKEPSAIEVFPDGDRDDGLSNQEVAGFVRENGRPFLGLNEKAVQQLRNIVLKNLRRVLRKTF